MASTVAILMACHNRRQQTLRCLDHVAMQVLPVGHAVRVYIVDDGSTDGTAEYVTVAHPSVTVIPGDGTLFWSGGMCLAWHYAARFDPAYYLLLNDDTYLVPGCLNTLIQVATRSASEGKEPCIVVGSCRDSITGQQSYGGQRLRGLHPARLVVIPPAPTDTQRCDTFTGNCVLITRAAFRVLGMMRRFRHAMSDTDYGLLARRAGIPVLLAPGYLAECTSNPVEASWRCRTLPRRKRWQMLLGPKGLPPGDWWKFLWTHAGVRAVAYWPQPYLRVLMGL